MTSRTATSSSRLQTSSITSASSSCSSGGSLGFGLITTECSGKGCDLMHISTTLCRTRMRGSPASTPNEGEHDAMKGILTAVTAIAALGLIVVAAIAAVGDGTSSARTMSAAPVVKAAAAPVVSVRRTSHGKTLVDGRGRTLYLFEADRANISNCTKSCLTV